MSIPISDLKAGDVLIFKGGELLNKDQIMKLFEEVINKELSKEEFFDILVTQLIMLLTNSDVSHSALVVAPGKLADEGPAGLGTHLFTAPDETSSAPVSEVYLRRLKSDDLLDPVVDAAITYVKSDEPYDYVPLVFIAGIVLYNHFSSTSRLKKALLIKLFIKAGELLDKKINARIHPDKKPMMCSQFVFQSFQDASMNEPDKEKAKEYNLHIKNGTVLKREMGVRLIDLVDRTLPNSIEEVSTETLVRSTSSEEEILRDLWEMFTSEEENDVRTEEFALSDELQSAIVKFCHSHNRLYGEEKGLQEMVQGMKYQPAMYVSPADLCYHCEKINSSTPFTTGDTVRLVRDSAFVTP